MNELLCVSFQLMFFAHRYVFPGTDIKGDMVAPHSTLSTTIEEHTSFYFKNYSRDCLVQVILLVFAAIQLLLKKKKVRYFGKYTCQKFNNRLIALSCLLL